MSESMARWARIKSLFESLAEVPASLREPLIKAAELEPTELAELSSLLAHHDRAAAADAFMAEPAAQTLMDQEEGGAAVPGQRLGAWEIVRLIGAGGMGEVFEARRADGRFEGRAAIKLLKRGMDSAAVMQRFALERQALARLSHPHIARLLDAGTAPAGVPYFVLEYVDGEAISEAVQDLTLDERLRLFLQLADAVSYAHRNLLVHRDLKPGNVLVDREGQVKLLDFGIAKALDPLEGNDGQATVGGQRPFTPNYASPEQVRGEPVSTATDIYSLGVLLYQLLTGTRPTGRNASTPAEAARCVLEDAPTKPSRLSPQEVSDPQWLQTRKKLSGDLDNILLKTLEKEPERRYSSVEAMATDLRRYLEGYPVSARPASWHYRLAKQVSRNRLASAALAASVLLLLGGSAAVAWKAQEARQAQLLAELRLKEVRRVTHELVFSFGDSVEYLPGGMKIKADLFKEALAALERLQPTLGESDEAALADIAEIHVRLAEAYTPDYPGTLNEPEKGLRHAEQARLLIDKVWASQKGNPVFAGYASRAYMVLAGHAREAGDKEKAVALSRHGLALVQEAVKLAPPNNTDTLLLHNAVTAGLQDLAVMLDDNGLGLGRPEDAMRYYIAARESGLKELEMKAEAARLDAKLRPEQTRFRAELLQTLAVINGSMASSHQRRGDYELAVKARDEAMAHLRQARQMHPEQLQLQASTAANLFLLAGLELQMDRPEQALKASTENHDLLAGLLATDPKNADWIDAREYRALAQGSALLRLNRHAEAQPWLRRSVNYWRKELVASPPAAKLKHQRGLALAEFRWERSRADWPAAAAAAEQLQTLADAEPRNADAYQAAAEAAQSLASDGPSTSRATWQQRACQAWKESAALRPLSPWARRQSGGCQPA